MGACLAEAADRADSDRIVSTQKAVARAVGVSDMTVSHWIRDDPTFPRIITPDGQSLFDIERIVQWMATRKGKRQRGRPSGGPMRAPVPGSDAAEFADPATQILPRTMEQTELLLDRQLRARVEKEEALAKQNTIKAEALEGRYVTREEFESAVVGLAALFRKLITEIPDRVRADDSEEVAVIVERHLDRVWAELDALRSQQLAMHRTESEDADEAS